MSKFKFSNRIVIIFTLAPFLFYILKIFKGKCFSFTFNDIFSLLVDYCLKLLLSLLDLDSYILTIYHKIIFVLNIKDNIVYIHYIISNNSLSSIIKLFTDNLNLFNKDFMFNFSSLYSEYIEFFGSDISLISNELITFTSVLVLGLFFVCLTLYVTILIKDLMHFQNDSETNNVNNTKERDSSKEDADKKEKNRNYMREYRAKNKEKIKQELEKRKKEDPEFVAKNKEIQARYRAKNKEKIEESRKIFNENNKEKIKEYDRKKYEKFRVRIATKAYRKRNEIPDSLNVKYFPTRNKRTKK